MPKLSNSAPKYRKHRASGQAVVTLNGRDFYLGPQGPRPASWSMTGSQASGLLMAEACSPARPAISR